MESECSLRYGTAQDRGGVGRTPLSPSVRHDGICNIPARSKAACCCLLPLNLPHCVWNKQQQQQQDRHSLWEYLPTTGHPSYLQACPRSSAGTRVGASPGSRSGIHRKPRRLVTILISFNPRTTNDIIRTVVISRRATPLASAGQARSTPSGRRGRSGRGEWTVSSLSSPVW